VAVFACLTKRIDRFLAEFAVATLVKELAALFFNTGIDLIAMAILLII
jgi:uncharacterized protein (DUF2164 family)